MALQDNLIMLPVFGVVFYLGAYLAQVVNLVGLMAQSGNITP